MYYKSYALIRDAQGLTDYAVAKGTGISTSTFTNWKQSDEPGQGYTPKLEKLMKIAQFLGVSLNKIIAEGQ